MRALLFAATIALASAGCATASREPRNLSHLKSELRAYVDSGRYQREIEKVAAEAKTWIEQRAARGGAKLTVVFDLDETLLLNWPHMLEMDFGYVTRDWQRWVDEAKAPPIEPVREVYHTARRLGVEVVYITGRPERDRAATIRNLRAIDCGDFAELICKPPGHRGASAEYKTAARQRLASEGRTIIANVGDQSSDLNGGFSERTFKLPNPFYFTE